MQIQIDFRSGVPIYNQIMEQIQRMIASGELKVGDQLPTVRQLATDLRVNFNTIARAYRMLDEAGLISTQQGRGTYIWARPTDEDNHNTRQRTLEELAFQFVNQAMRLGASTEEITAAFQKQLDGWSDTQPHSN